MTEAKIKVTNLERASVWFHPADGPSVQARVTYVWPQMGVVPGINLERYDNGEEETSVPHRSSVPEASRFFWTLGTSPDVNESH